MIWLVMKGLFGLSNPVLNAEFVLSMSFLLGWLLMVGATLCRVTPDWVTVFSLIKLPKFFFCFLSFRLSDSTDYIIAPSLFLPSFVSSWDIPRILSNSFMLMSLMLTVYLDCGPLSLGFGANSWLAITTCLSLSYESYLTSPLCIWFINPGSSLAVKLIDDGPSSPN